MTLRAAAVLRDVDVVAAEDTRHSLKLLNHLEIPSKPLVSYWGEKEKAQAERVIKLLSEGKDVALISDAGTPGISDPGEVVVRRALEENFEIIPIPGPSALTAALSVCGISTQEFTFIGFMPSKSGARRKRLEALSLEPRTLVFYESPHRIVDMLIDLEEIFGNRNAAVFKELTKLYESVYRGPLASILDTLENEMIAGEYVVIIEGKSPEEGRSIEEALGEVGALMKKGLGRKEAVKSVAEQWGFNKRDLYNQSLEGE